MDFSTPGLSVHHQLPEFTRTHIHWVSDANHLILRCPLLFPPSIFPSIRVFSNESVLLTRWPKDWSFSFSTSPSNEYSELISFTMDWLDLLAVQGTLKSLLQHHSSKAITANLITTNPKCVGFPGGSVVKKESEQCRRCGFDPWIRKTPFPWGRKWQPTPVFLPGKFHRQRSLMGYSPWVHKKSDMTNGLNNPKWCFESRPGNYASSLFHWPPNCPVPVISAYTEAKLLPAWLYLLP